ncbi:MAG: XTP/dITP diphosphatase [Candidatus Anstonellales archaeon]
MNILFVTSNAGKFIEAKKILKERGINIAHKHDLIQEVRAEDCAVVAKEAARYAYEKYRKPLFVEDSGIFIKSLEGFPGAYSAYVYRKIGLDGILKLLENKKDRSAEFVSCIGYADKDIIKIFSGKCVGNIAKRISGSEGFGYDPIFIPKGKKSTFGEDKNLKDVISHRRLALEKLAIFLKKRFGF